MPKWEYCVVYGGWQQETWVYYLSAERPEGYQEEHHAPDEQSTFKIVELNKRYGEPGILNSEPFKSFIFTLSTRSFNSYPSS